MITIGRRVYGLGAIALGLIEMCFGQFAEAWFPVPAGMPGYQFILYGGAGLMILAGIGVNLPQVARVAALILAALFAAGVLALHLPHALTHITQWVSWQGVAEGTAMALGGVLVAAMLDAPGQPRTGRVLLVARLLFGLCLLVFGVSHFVYAGFTAAMVPGWLPPTQMFWAYATGVFQFAAGLAMLSGVQARLAAILLTIMYAGFGLLVHLPLLLHDPSTHMVWAENCINLLLTGAAWCLAEAMGQGAASGAGRISLG